jgi:hypothetical protein
VLEESAGDPLARRGVRRPDAALGTPLDFHNTSVPLFARGAKRNPRPRIPHQSAIRDLCRT